MNKENVTVRLLHLLNCASKVGLNEEYKPVPTINELEVLIKMADILRRNKYYTPDALHREWCRLQKNDGWVYGQQWSEDKKTDPFLLDFRALSVENQNKFKVYSHLGNELIRIIYSYSEG